jgi:hypothetical protein
VDRHTEAATNVRSGDDRADLPADAPASVLKGVRQGTLAGFSTRDVIVGLLFLEHGTSKYLSLPASIASSSRAI